MSARRMLALARLEIRLFLREPVAVFFSVVFPLLLLAFVGSVYGAEVDDGVRFIDSYVPIMVGVSAANTGVMGLSIHLAEERSRGVLRRIRLSPVRDLEYFGAQMITSVVALALSFAGLSAFTLAVYGPGAGIRIPAFIGASLLAMYVCFSVGIFLGGLRLPVRSVQVAGTVVFFFMFFSSGAAIQRSQFPPWLRTVSDVNPLTHLNALLSASYTGSGDVAALGVALSVMLALGLNVAASRTFDWEGRQ